MKQKRNRQKYTKEFKDDAVKLVIEQGYNANETGRRLGVNPCNITQWVREYRDTQEENSGTSRRELETENRHLRKENKRLQMEREILKKAAAFFAKESK